MSSIFVNDSFYFPSEQIIKEIINLWWCSFKDVTTLKENINKLINQFSEKRWLKKKNEYYEINNYFKWSKLPNKEDRKEIENIIENFYENSNKCVLTINKWWEKEKLINKINVLKDKYENQLNQKKLDKKVKKFFNDLIDLFFQILKLIIDNVVINKTNMKKNIGEKNDFILFWKKITFILIIKILFIFIIICSFFYLYFKWETVWTVISLILWFIAILQSWDNEKIKDELKKSEINIIKEVVSLKTDIKRTEYISEKNHILTSFHLKQIKEDYKNAALENLKIKYGIKD